MKTTCVLRVSLLHSCWQLLSLALLSLHPVCVRKYTDRNVFRRTFHISCQSPALDWLRELVRQTRQDRWEVTRVSRGSDARLQTHWTSAALCVVACVTARVCNTTDKKHHVNMIPLRSGVTLLKRNARGDVSQPAALEEPFVADTLGRGMCVCWVM